MSSPSLPESINPRFEEMLRLRKYWAWLLALGITLVLLGVAAMGAQLVVTLTTVLVFGILLLAGGVVQVVNAVLARGWRVFFLHLMAGVLHLVVGGLMIDRPVRAAEALTLMLAVAFLVGGSLRIVYVLLERFPGSAWVLLNGVVTLLLGVGIWRQWPGSSLWVIGLFVGIDLVFNGWSWVMLAMALKALPPGRRVVAPSTSREVTAPTASGH
jgi:uncharacterized membrane protein HdeD (DUF308 family)